MSITARLPRTLAIATPKTRRRRLSTRARLLIVWSLAALACLAYLLLFIRGNPAFALERRAGMLAAMLVVAFAQGLGTVVFHAVTDNRILTPSVMGFDSLYVLMQTALVFVFGGEVLAQTEGPAKIVVQTVLMVGFATVLYRWLLGVRFGNLTILLLVGVVFGLAFDSVAVFLQRLLDPTDHSLLTTRMFGRMSAVDPLYLPLALVVCGVAAVVLARRHHVLDALLLGRDRALAIGVEYRRELTGMLLLVATLVAFSTALAGPMTFFGFVVAHLAYAAAGTYRHAVVLPMAWGMGLLTLASAQFVLQHVFYAQGLVSVIIEFAGGLVFLAVLLRKGGHL